MSQKLYLEVDERAARLNEQLKIEHGIMDEDGNLLLDKRSSLYKEKMALVAASISSQIYGSE